MATRQMARGNNWLVRCIPLVLCGASPAMAVTVSDFNVFNYSGLQGRLLVPNNYDPNKSYPLVMFLDGLGGAGTDNVKPAASSISNNLAAQAGVAGREFFLYTPQSGSGWWGTDGNLRTAAKAVAEISVQYNIDPGKLYVTGLSSGGGGTIGIMATPQVADLFSAYVPLSPSIDLPASQAAANVNKPVWLYAARNDGTYTGFARATINTLRNAQGLGSATFPLNNNPSNPNYNNGSPYYSDGSTFYSHNAARYSEYQTGGHSSATWGRAYNEPQLYEWLFAQTNGASTLASGRSILIDFSDASGESNADSQGRRWNTAGSSWYWNDYNVVGVSVGFARDDTGQRTGTHVRVANTFASDSNTSPASVPAGSPLFDAAAAGDYWAAGRWDWNPNNPTPSRLIIDGLAPGEKYDLSIFASIAGNDGGRQYFGSYLVQDATGRHEIIFNAADNLNQLVSGPAFQNLVANANGELTLTMMPVNGSRYAIINTLTLTAVPEPAFLGLVGLGATGLIARRRRASVCD